MEARCPPLLAEPGGAHGRSALGDFPQNHIFPEEGELPWWLSGKEPTCNAGDPGSIPGWGRFPGGGNGNPTGVLLPGKSHGQRNLVGYSPWGCKILHLLDTVFQSNVFIEIMRGKKLFFSSYFKAS